MNFNLRLGSCVCLLLCACAGTPDHFYTLSPLPDTGRGKLTTPAIHVLLNVTVPPLVDRPEMVISTSTNGILVLDHERWVGLLSDQVSQTLARDIEKRRNDVLVGDRAFDQVSSPPVTMKVDVIRMSARQGGRATLEAHWRIVDERAGMDEIGSGLFEAQGNGADYTSVAKAYSEALSALAERLAESLPGTGSQLGK